MMEKQRGFTLIEALYIPLIALLLVGAGGWVMNIVHLAQVHSASGFVVLRIVGIFMAPLGAVLGFFPN